MSTTKQTEEYLQKLRRLPSNKICANCRITSRLGFGAVCVKYQTFVCDLCKSAHQSYSHRTKSVTMSVWNMEEVKALDEKNGGGNDCCRAKWFGKLSESEEARYTPKEGDPLDTYKRFVLLAYEKSKWLDENGKPNTVPTSTTPPAVTTTTNSTPKKKIPSKPSTPSPATAKRQAEEDLLILDFDAKVTTISPPIPISSNTPSPSNNNNLNSTSPIDEWSSFAAATSSSSPLAVANGKLTETSLSDDWTFHAAPPINSLPTLTTAPILPLQKPISLAQPQPSLAVRQDVSYGQVPFPSNAHVPPLAPTTNGFVFPQSGFTNNIVQPPISYVQVPPYTLSPSVGVADDPFSHLHSFNSAPAVMAPIRSNSAGSIGTSTTGLARSNSTGNAGNTNDPFAGLF